MSHATSTDNCSWCGLPLSERWWVSRVESPSDSPDAPSSSVIHADEYCCFGCRFAAQVTSERGESGQLQWTLTRLGIAIFFAMNVSMFTMALWSHDVYDVEPGDRLAAVLTDLMVWLSFLCSLPVLFLLGIPVASSALVSLRGGRITTDLLVAIGVAAAFGYSVVSVINGEGHIYFEVASLVLVLTTLGRWLEASGRLHSNEVLDSLSRLLPESARRIVSQSDIEDRPVPLADLRTDDLVRVLPGERIPADGIIINQTVTIDEQMLTGESLPVIRHPGDEVSSGTLNLDAELILRVTRAGSQDAVHRLMEIVREARQSQGYYQRLADRVTTWFVPLTAVAAGMAVAGNWLMASPAEAILSGLAVVLIACPCALGLATSVAVWTALGTAARRGVLIRSGEVLEKLARIRAVGFDKTGTLTTGQAQVVRMVCLEGTDPVLVWTLAGQLCSRSTHSYSRAIRNAAQEALAESGEAAATQVSVPTLSDVKSITGRGLKSAEDVCLGSLEFVRNLCPASSSESDATLERLQAGSQALVLSGWSGRLRCVFVLDETVRDEARAAIAACDQLDLSMQMLTGDRPERATAIGQAVGLPVRAGLKPEAKLSAIRHMREQSGPVLMTGDGINDAPALAAADVGVALGCGTDVSRDAAGICLLTDDLTAIPWVIALGRRTRRIILQNLGWAFGYNAIGMTLAAFRMLNPVIAAIVMFVSSLVVLANSRRLARFDFPEVTSLAKNTVSPSRATVQSVPPEAARVLDEREPSLDMAERELEAVR